MGEGGSEHHNRRTQRERHDSLSLYTKVDLSPLERRYGERKALQLISTAQPQVREQIHSLNVALLSTVIVVLI